MDLCLFLQSQRLSRLCIDADWQSPEGLEKRHTGGQWQLQKEFLQLGNAAALNTLLGLSIILVCKLHILDMRSRSLPSLTQSSFPASSWNVPRTCSACRQIKRNAPAGSIAQNLLHTGYLLHDTLDCYSGVQICAEDEKVCVALHISTLKFCDVVR